MLERNGNTYLLISDLTDEERDGLRGYWGALQSLHGRDMLPRWDGGGEFTLGDLLDGKKDGPRWEALQGLAQEMELGPRRLIATTVELTALAHDVVLEDVAATSPFDDPPALPPDSSLDGSAPDTLEIRRIMAPHIQIGDRGLFVCCVGCLVDVVIEVPGQTGITDDLMAFVEPQLTDLGWMVWEQNVYCGECRDSQRYLPDDIDPDL